MSRACGSSTPDPASRSRDRRAADAGSTRRGSAACSAAGRRCSRRSAKSTSGRADLPVCAVDPRDRVAAPQPNARDLRCAPRLVAAADRAAAAGRGEPSAATTSGDAGASCGRTRRATARRRPARSRREDQADDDSGVAHERDPPRVAGSTRRAVRRRGHPDERARRTMRSRRSTARCDVEHRRPGRRAARLLKAYPATAGSPRKRRATTPSQERRCTRRHTRDR